MFHKNTNELAYPFLYEPPDSLTCDFEILTDEISSLCGLARSLLPEGDALRDELLLIVGKVYDLNGSLRGKCAIAEEDIQRLSMLCGEYSRYAISAGSVFVLPAGHPAACAVHVARVRAKAAVRLLYREHEASPREQDEALIRYANVLSNYLFLLALKINADQGVEEIPFQSRSYGHKQEEE